MAKILKMPAEIGRGWALTQVVRGGRINRAGASAAVGDDGGRFFGYSLRTDRWRYTEWADGELGRELYDHEKDPRELVNLANSKEHNATIQELSKQLQLAVKSSMPADGVIPALKAQTWAPNLTNP